MTSTSPSLASPALVADIVAGTADQFLISYILLSRFEDCGPHAATFTLAHCIELSIKAVHWHVRAAPPPFNHRLDEIIGDLQDELGTEFLLALPDPLSRDRFKRRIDDINTSVFMEMLESFYEINPNWDDDKWAVLYALYRPVHLKYGVDRRPAVIQLMLPEKLHLNRMALRLIGIARKRFPNPEGHQKKIQKFVSRLPRRRTIIDALDEYFAKGSADFDPEVERKAEGPFPRMTFDGEELELLKDTLLV
jgi:hypothetical protein